MVIKEQIWYQWTALYSRPTLLAHSAGAKTMAFDSVLFAMIFLSSLCMIQASSKRDRSHVPIEAPSAIKSEEWVSVLVPSLAPYAPNQSTSQENSHSTAAPAAGTASPQQSIVPLRPSSGSDKPVRNATIFPCFSCHSQIVSDVWTFGHVGVESDLFRKECKKFCEQNSGRSCRLVRKPKRHALCKAGSFLGKMRMPHCCFYVHCLRIRRPRRRSKNWWKHTNAKPEVQRACGATAGML